MNPLVSITSTSIQLLKNKIHQEWLSPRLKQKVRPLKKGIDANSILTKNDVIVEIRTKKEVVVFLNETASF